MTLVEANRSAAGDELGRNASLTLHDAALRVVPACLLLDHQPAAGAAEPAQVVGCKPGAGESIGQDAAAACRPARADDLDVISRQLDHPLSVTTIHGGKPFLDDGKRSTAHEREPTPALMSAYPAAGALPGPATPTDETARARRPLTPSRLIQRMRLPPAS